jgi:hypothetical protein
MTGVFGDLVKFILEGHFSDVFIRFPIPMKKEKKKLLFMLGDSKV